MTLPNDDYGRTVTLSGTFGGFDTYTIGVSGLVIALPLGAGLSQLYSSINGMAPVGWSPGWTRTDVPMNTTSSSNASLNIYATSDGNLHVEVP